MKQLPKLNLKLEPILKESYVTLHPTTGWSYYKEWPIDRWEQVVAAFPHIKFIQIGLSTDTKVKGCDHSFMNTDLMTSIALIANAKAHLGGDSFSNHVTYMSNTPAIILWGSTQHDASGYEQNINVSLGLSCQPCWKEKEGMSSMPRGKCENLVDGCHACMAGITSDMIIKELTNLLV